MAVYRAIFFSALVAAIATTLPVTVETNRDLLDSRLANVHIASSLYSDIDVTYGPCNAIHKRDAHHVVGRSQVGSVSSVRRSDGTLPGPRQTRLVWIMPEDIESGGCLSAWALDTRGKKALVGRSIPQSIEKKHRQWHAKSKRQAIPMTNASGIDAEGPWFDGVAVLKAKGIGTVDAEAAKAKSAGMSGLMATYCLNASGFTNLELIEGGQRLGGRVHTVYFGDSENPDYPVYQEMGPMRFPYELSYPDTNETIQINDHKIVFQLAQELNEVNGFASNFTVNFIKWIQASPNGLVYRNGIRKANGMPPTITEISQNPNLTVSAPENPTLSVAEQAVANISNNDALIRASANNVYKAHKAFLDSGLGGLGGDDWSESAYLHNVLNYSLAITDQAVGLDGSGFWAEVPDNVYFNSKTTGWRTIDGGLNRLPSAFHPLVDGITSMNKRIERVEYLRDSSEVVLSWRDSILDNNWQNQTYDYALLAVPFPVIKRWRFPNTTVNPLIQDAIATMPYTPACKVALVFKTRFWENFENPIYGSCSTSSDIPGIGTYNLNGNGKGAMLASYISGNYWGEVLGALTEEEHVAYVLQAMVEIHGQVAADQYTGEYSRVCWQQDQLELASWASPNFGQHKLYIPEFFKTENNLIFIGEHTSYTHAWIASALESGVRGAVQLLLELGLVDEAKEITRKFMGRWISV